jgi:hypothetical protein
MRNHFAALVGKNKAKTPEDEKNFKKAGKVFDMLDKEISELFGTISRKDGKPVFGVIDRTIEVEDLVIFLKKIDLLWNETPPKKEKPNEEDSHKEDEAKHDENEKHEDLNESAKSKQADKSKNAKHEENKSHEEPAEDQKEEKPQPEVVEDFMCPADKISLFELINIIEKYYNPRKTLMSVLRNKIDPEDYNKEYNAHKLTNRYYMHIKGSELILFEFKEILLEISTLLRLKIDPDATIQVRSLLKKFIEDTLIKRNNAFKDPEIVKPKTQPAERKWPDSNKDRLIQERRETERIRQAEEKKKKQEEVSVSDLSEVIKFYFRLENSKN